MDRAERDVEAERFRCCLAPGTEPLLSAGVPAALALLVRVGDMEEDGRHEGSMLRDDSARMILGSYVVVADREGVRK